jgi:hypothetical protein
VARHVGLVVAPEIVLEQEVGIAKRIDAVASAFEGQRLL